MAEQQLIWYFDFVSPYSYLQFAGYPGLFRQPGVELRPVLFAGLLDHWGQKGPAEIAPKRLHTYRQVLWQARSRGVPMKCPPAHPFNPIQVLRLAIALGCTADAVQAIFDFIWREGRSVGDEWHALVERLGIADADARIAAPAVKEHLKKNGDEAIRAGVFGVPTFLVGTELFWGVDSTPMLLAWLADRRLFDSPEWRAIEHLPAAAQRKTV